MCWDTDADSVPIVAMCAATPLASCEYNLCWDTEQTPPRVHLAPNLEPVTMETLTVDGSIPFSVGQYNMGWTDSPCASVVGFAGKYPPSTPPTATDYYVADFDMCWGDVSPGRDIHLDSASPIAPPIDLVESGLSELCIGDRPVQSGPADNTQISYDMCFDHCSPVASPAPTDGLPSQIVDTGEELLRRATMRLDSIDAVISRFKFIL